LTTIQNHTANASATNHNQMKAKIQKTTGKGTAINEVQRPSTEKYLTEYDRIFSKPTKKGKSK